jgi:NADPH-dependent curcumin reductase CurA
LEKDATKTINYRVQSGNNENLMILCKTSLRNVEVSVKYKEEDYTKKMVARLYPNGYSIFIDSKEQEVYDENYKNLYITIKNKKKQR